MIVVKSPAELELMMEACKITAGALRVAGEAVRPGITTGHIDKLVREYIQSFGAKPSFFGYGDYPASACISINDEVIHGIPGPREIQEGDIVSVDVGAYYKGFHGDNAATFPAGRISPAARKLLDVTKESLQAGLAQVKPGARIGDISHAVQTVAEAAGFSVVRDYVGHGVGRDLHEDPQIPNYGNPGRGPRLIPGMTLAIEPMVNAGKLAVKSLSDGWTVKTVDESLSAHFEHTVAVTDTGYIVLTSI